MDLTGSTGAQEELDGGKFGRNGVNTIFMYEILKKKLFKKNFPLFFD